MSKQSIIVILMLLLGLGGGYGIGYLVNQSEIDAAKTEIDDLQDEVKRAEDASQDGLEQAATEIAEAKADTQRALARANRLDSELKTASENLQKVNLENQRLNALLKEVMLQIPGVDPAVRETLEDEIPTESMIEPGDEGDVAPEPGRGMIGVTRDYTVQDGDSLWKIAEIELGNGIRYKEIISLNPGIDENTRLNIGMKLKLPVE